MKSILLSISVFFTIHSYSQTFWTKNDRESLYSEYLNMLSKYKTVSLEQKESIALCALESTTAKYNKSDFETKIDIELKRIYESQMSQCSKNIGVDLQLSSQMSETKEETTSRSDWTKEEKVKLSKEFIAFLGDYPNITDTQKEELSLCYVQKTVTDNSPSSFAELIELEIKQQRMNTLKKCAEGSGIDLSKEIVKQTKVEVNKTYGKKDVIGSWSAEGDMTFVFNENNTCSIFYKEKDLHEYKGYYMYLRDDKGFGNFFIDENGVLTMNQKMTFFEYKMFGKTVDYNTEFNFKFIIVFNDGNFMKLKLIEIDGEPAQEAILQMNKVNN